MAEGRTTCARARAGDLVALVPAPAVVHRAGVVVGANAAMAAAVGCAELVGQCITALVHPDDREAAATLAAGDDAAVSLRLGDITVDVVQHPVDLDGEQLAVAVLADVTARAATEARFTTLMRNATDMVAVHVDSCFTYISPAVTRILGWETDDCIGHHVSMLFHPDDHAQLEARMAERQRGIAASTPGRYRMLCKDGGWRWVETVSSVHSDDPAGRGIVVNARDITASVEAEAALRTSEARHRALVEHLSDVILVTDAQGTISYVSPGISRMLGLSPELVTGLTIFTGMHDDDLEHAHQRFAEALAGGSGLYGPERFRYRHADGWWRHLETSASNRLDDPSVAGLVFVIRDVSEQVQAEDRLRHLALHDPLTGLANRTLLTDRLQSALAAGRRDGSTTALLVLDLDRFKAVNDGFGHEAGDAVLSTMADRLRAQLRESDTLGRLGGDEFAVVLPSAVAEDEAARTGRRMVAVLGEPLLYRGAEITLGGSIGLACAPVHGDDADTLLRRADLAMFRAKGDHLGFAVFGDLDRARERR